MFRTRLLQRLVSVTNAVRNISEAGGAKDIASGASETRANLRGARTVLTGERGINKVTLLGRAGQDALVRGTTENSITVFPLATSYTLKTVDGEYVQRTEWHRITIMRPVLRDLAAQHVKKGDRIYVTGAISYSQWRDKDNVVQRSTSIIADDFINVTRPMTSTGAEEENS